VGFPAAVTPALDAAPELGAVLASQWIALDERDRRRPLVLLAHGPTDGAEAARWVANVSIAAGAALRDAGLESPVRVGLLRDDAPPPLRAAAISELRDTVQALAARGRDSVLVLPVLISSGAINRVTIPRDLQGLPVRVVPVGLAPHPALARWIERVAGAVRSANTMEE
jgi:sirohydrochlorin ferrochelatase